MKKPIFSIIVPVYNAEGTIERSINRLQSLEFNDYEVILVNDGSTDKTEQLIHQLVDKNPKFQWVTTKNQGPGFARNEGLNRARGEYILFFDADDTPNRAVLKEYEQLLKKQPNADLIVSSFIFRTIDDEKVISEKINQVTEHRYTKREEFLQDMYTLMNQQLMYVVWNKCYRKDLLEKYSVRFKNYSSCEDRIFNLDYFEYCDEVLMNPSIVYTYEFQGGKGITNKYNKNKFQTFEDFYLRANEVTNNNNKAGMASLLLKGTTSVLLSIAETYQLTNIEKRHAIKEILNSDVIREARSIACTDSIIKKLTKFYFNLPSTIAYHTIIFANKIQRISPRLIALLKRKY